VARRGRRYVPSEREVRELAEAAPTEAMGAFTLVAAFSGLRLFEVAALRREDFDSAGSLHVRCGKGGYERWSLLYEPGLAAIEDVLPRAGLVWRTSHGNRWDRRYVSRMWRGMRSEVGLPAAAVFHSLRHFHACWLLDRGAAVQDVAVQLGHHDRGELVQRRYGRMMSEDAARKRLGGLR
jgi:integrase